MAVVSEKKCFFLKKVNKLFASSDFVATFASAFEKNAPFLSKQRVYNKGAPSRKRGSFFKKCKVFWKNVCRIEKDVLSLQSFRTTKCGFFRYGSLNYWFYLRE